MMYSTFSATASGKVILFGEHATVYGRPAIAIPVTEVNACAEVSTYACEKIRISAPDIHLDLHMDELPVDHPIASLLINLQKTYLIPAFRSFSINIHSTIPVAAGMGSSAAVTVAIIRALSKYFNLNLDNPQISNLAYEIEKIQHGSPSGIDNTVITYQQPVFFQRDHPIIPIKPIKSFSLLIGDTGIPSKTSESVGRVRSAWQKEPALYDRFFDKIGEITILSKSILEGEGTDVQLGSLMNENHRILQGIGVSCDELDNLVNNAVAAGAFGAKLCGSGNGGNMIALIEEKSADSIREALFRAGAVRVIKTKIEPSGRSYE